SATGVQSCTLTGLYLPALPRSGSRRPLLASRPLRTVHETFASYGSSLPQRPSQDAAWSVSVSFARGFAGGSCRATTPGCRTCSDLRGNAKPDDVCARARLLPEAFARTPRTYLLAPATDSRSGPVLQESDPTSRSPALPGTVPMPDRRGWPHS